MKNKILFSIILLSLFATGSILSVKANFFEEGNLENKNMQELQVQREKHENVIDKLIAGETLTSEEKIILEDVKKKREEMKIKKAEMKEKMKEMKPILQKVKAKETLTEEENKLFLEFKNNKHKKQKGGCFNK